ncbi:MAG TPA: CocE/NonD family hydrolase, partial [Ktedonobacteraceae bacterium]|nr:CocE/NonD family hydrolase [Ktedonobacteraceae bacterium]
MPASSTREIRIDFNRRVPMRDGITLSADVYTPANRSGEAKQFPVILTRTPYLKLSEGMLGVARYFAER